MDADDGAAELKALERSCRPEQGDFVWRERFVRLLPRRAASLRDWLTLCSAEHPSRFVLAAHEAGHAAVVAAHGIRINSVALAGSNGHCLFDGAAQVDPKTMALIILAGPVAERDVGNTAAFRLSFRSAA